MSNTQIVRACFDAYLAQDRDTAARLLADGYVFTSPQDDHIDKDAFLERCFPTAARLNWQRLLTIADIEPADVFILYEYELTTGERHRNTEISTVHDGQLTETQVFFGGAVAG